MIANELPRSLIDNPVLGRWLAFLPDGRVRLSVGKVELGQGIMTALAQIAAEELDIAPARVTVRAGDTEAAPDEGMTVGSMSIEVSGAAVRLVAAEVRDLFLDRLAARGLARPGLEIRDGAFLSGGAPTGESYWSLAAAVDLERPVRGDGRPKEPGAYRLVGTSLPRLDLPATLAGAAFIQDLALPGMRHARVLRQPGPAARLGRIDEAAIRRAAREPLEIVRVGAFLAFVAEDELVAARAIEGAETGVEWLGLAALEPGAEEAAWLVGRPAVESGTPAAGPFAVEAVYARPYLSHGSIGPSCALAQMQDGRLTVWSHTQGVYPLRQGIAQALGLAEEAVAVRHVQGCGCYGHNGADDVALDAAIIARALPGRPVRVQWRRADELGFEPVGPAMQIRLGADLGADGRPVRWHAEIWSGNHANRGRLLAEDALPDARPAPEPRELPDLAGGGATRNATPLYDIAEKSVHLHLTREPPVRTSALRGLGALPNVFAIEGFVDELAARAGADPVEYRLAMLGDPRARRVVERVAALAGWGTPVPEGAARGIGFARYKNRGAYAAVVAELAVEETVRLRQLWCVADAGLVINPDGAVNQLEGGMIQAASWVLKEQVRLDGTGIASRSWEDYPILRFSEVPELAVELVAAPEERPLGIGEASLGPTAGAIGNAVASALGLRIRALPMTRQRIMAALLAEEAPAGR